MDSQNLYSGFIFPNQMNHHSGKVREMYSTYDRNIVMIATNRFSAFNHVFDEPIPYKGAVLNGIAAFMFKESKGLVPNWFKSMPNAITSIGEAVEPIKLEIIVRSCLVGHAWREYKSGKRELCGEKLPEGMKEYDMFPEPIITPTLKTKYDEDISFEDIIERNILPADMCDDIKRYAIALFGFGSMVAQKNGLFLADTKYEFGLTDQRKLIVIDEINTPDSSRYFYKKDYDECLKSGGKPEHVSKEFAREWLIEQGWGEEESKKGLPAPKLTPEIISKISAKYIELYETIVGEDFPYEEARKAQDEKYVFLNSRLEIQRLRFPESKPVVGIVMGSDSDLPIMDKAAFVMEDFGVNYELTIISAHRTPHRMEEYAKMARERGLKVIIAGAGGAAHLPGMISGATTLPVIGVPIKSSNSIDGWDSILSILQMPEGVPTLTVSLDGAKNAGIAAVQILATSDEKMMYHMIEFKTRLTSKVLDAVRNVAGKGYPNEFEG